MSSSSRTARLCISNFEIIWIKDFIAFVSEKDQENKKISKDQVFSLFDNLLGLTSIWIEKFLFIPNIVFFNFCFKDVDFSTFVYSTHWKHIEIVWSLYFKFKNLFNLIIFTLERGASWVYLIAKKKLIELMYIGKLLVPDSIR